MTTLEFTGDGKILAGGKQVGEFGPDERDQYGNGEWRALLWAVADVPGEFGRLDSKLAGLRYGSDAAQCEKRVRARLNRGGPWWTEAAACAYCGERIAFLGGTWTTDDGTTACHANPDTTAAYVPHKPKGA